MSSRTVVRISGTDTREFLQGLVTNDIGKLESGLVYAALLSPQGKYLADFFLVPDGDDVLLDVATEQADGLLRRLGMYKLRAAVTIAQTDMKVFRGIGEMPSSAFPDPRTSALGWRLYGDMEGDDGTDWDALRVAHAIPAAGLELQPDSSFILEMGFERLNGVDFRKGCYVGQEVTARMKHKAELRKGLARVQVDGDAEQGAEITADGKPVGTLHTRSGNEALAYLRFDRAGKEMRAGEAVVQLLPV
ncbi:YgfZ/GcvT domain-containing protein [Qingshengfaniella alkalisoli]|uniref:Folate-binding protein YgfZ n=1 Tax=Qingshengfaniella alkalisoli TaxID=2599296 RepID=A0A5B8IU34_9RHOB|nr:folate-binding protein YgfZ [Qingshengfaniella alkalisoli]QDY69682.1 folate-binding protein YgfZ [Qingshengfaniella alkalisoli]